MTTNILSSSIVLEVLRKDNYANWSTCIKQYLLAQDLWDIIETSMEPPRPEENVIEFRAWRKKNAAALHAIQISCDVNVLSEVNTITSAKLVWDILRESLSQEVRAGNSVNTNNHLIPEYADFYWAVHSGDWDSVMEFLISHNDAVSARTSKDGDTALHRAVKDGHTRTVEKLVELMSERDLEIQDDLGATALYYAATIGNTRMAECMVRKNKNLVSIGDGSDFTTPLMRALGIGNIETARYLYAVTPLEDLEKDTYGSTVMTLSTVVSCFDIALHLLRRCPRLGLLPDMTGNSLLSVLATEPSVSQGRSRLIFWKRWIYDCIPVRLAQSTNEILIDVHSLNKHESDQVKISGSVLRVFHRSISNLITLVGIKQVYEMKVLNVQALQLLHQICKELKGSNYYQTESNFINEAIFMAIEAGNIELIVHVVRADHRLLWSVDSKSRTIFSNAVLYRQAKIFSLLHGLEAKNAMTSLVDESHNSLLHFAGTLEPSNNQLDRIPGAALQMQRELQWFKEVERISPSVVKDLRNKLGKTAREVFTENHKDMVNEGEKWMKETASSSTVVGALIITIMFAAAFTVPGGNNQDTGLPVFSNKRLFMLFIVSDALSLFSSSTSVLMFLGILTSRYAEEDFLKSLPTKMIIGLSTLFFSIVTMMIAFTAALFIMLPGQSWMVIPGICLASVPVTLFVFMQFPLLVDMFTSTYGPGIFDKKTKLWL